MSQDSDPTQGRWDDHDKAAVIAHTLTNLNWLSALRKRGLLLSDEEIRGVLDEVCGGRDPKWEKARLEEGW
jgi:hypothetical protein